MIKKTYTLRQAGNAGCQVMVPPMWRKQFNLDIGDSVEMEILEDCLIIRPVLSKEGKGEINK